MSRPVIEFGPFRLDPNEEELSRNGERIPLTPKAFELLQLLAERGGHLVRKEELLASVWPGTFVEEAVLSVNMSAVRKALGDEGRGYIETVPRRGYRFVEPTREKTCTDGSAAAGTFVRDEPPSNARPPAWRVARVRWALVGSLIAGGLGILLYRALPELAVTSGVVVVLPLDSESTGSDHEHFADSMTEVLIAELGEMPGLKVISPASALEFKHSDKPLPSIARELNARYVVTGKIGRDNRTVRLTARLLEAPSERQLWTMEYERDLTETFALQKEVAASVARRLGAPSRIETSRATAGEIPAEAYEAYLRGNYLLDAGKSRSAIEEFRKAVSLSPHFANAHARIASAYFGFGFYGGMAPSEAWVNMKEAAEKALEHDPENAEAHAALALVKLHYDWDWQASEREFRRALDLNPNDVDARHMYAHYLLTVGRVDASLVEMDRAFEIDPAGTATAT